MASQQESPYKGSASITREQFLFYEMRTTARLMQEGLSEEQVIEQIVQENLFQYPTEKSVRRMAKACVRRLNTLSDEVLIEAISARPSEEAKQVCMYAMMKQYRLIWDFMITVIGEKYRIQDFSFSRMDVNVFFMQLQEQDDYVAGWSENTVMKIKQVIVKMLVENEYIDNLKADHINPVWLSPILDNAIRSNGDERALAAFNCFS
jgi:DNA-binding Lrp family transcriptional regulator